MQPLKAGTPMLPIDSHFDGVGVTLYVSPPDGSREDIVFDRLRPLGRTVVVIDSALDVAEYVRSDAGVARVEQPATSLDWTIPDEYLGTTFWVQLRPFENGLELDTVDGARRVVLTDDGDVETRISGRVLITKRELLANAGIAIEWLWFGDVLGVAPTSWQLRSETDGSGDVPADLDVVFDVGRDSYSARLSGFTDGETYRVQLYGLRGAAEMWFATVEFVADGSGADVALTASVEEET